MHYNRLLLGPFALVAMLAMPAAAQAPQSWTQVGGLSCQVDPNVGFIVVGSQSMRCLFTPNAPQEREAYAGALNTVGLNVGISAGGVLGWAVFAPTTGLPVGALAGEYVGVSGDIGIGRCRRERSPWRFQPHHRASADFASRVDRIERGGRFVVAQAAPFAAVICDMPTTPTNVRFRGDVRFGS
jgi:Protein of unknown function (DUF992)